MLPENDSARERQIYEEYGKWLAKQSSRRAAIDGKTDAENTLLSIASLMRNSLATVHRSMPCREERSRRRRFDDDDRRSSAARESATVPRSAAPEPPDPDHRGPETGATGPGWVGQGA